MSTKRLGSHCEINATQPAYLYLAESSNRERLRRRTLALAQSLERTEQRYQATLISDDELVDEIDDTDLLTEEKIIPNAYDYTDLCFGVLFGILLSLLFDLTQQIIANGL